MSQTFKSLAVLFLFWTQPALANFYALECNGNFQLHVGKDTETVALKEADAGGFGDLKLAATLNSFSYEVVWHKSLDTFYMTIKNGTQQLLFSTARVPSFEHNDTMADIRQQDGTRLWISCGYKPK